MVRFPRLSGLCGLVALCAASSLPAKAVSFSGNFAADNSSFGYTFTTTGTTNFSANTTSFATGGFLPVLTLYNATTGNELFSDGSGPEAGLRDATLSGLLGAGTYDLFLTEFPNADSGNGTLSGGFLFAGDPTATGDVCGVAGGMFLDSAVAPCTQRTSAYALTETTSAVGSAVTPEPPSALLMLLPLAGVVVLNRRKLFTSPSF